MRRIGACVHLGQVVFGAGGVALAFIGTPCRSRTALAAVVLLPPEAVARHRERRVPPRRAWDPLRFALLLLARCCAWREALTIVQPATRLRRQGEAFRLLWRWQSRPGRPLLPVELQQLIGAMVRDNATWGEERIATELLLELGIRVSSRTIRRYVGRGSGGGGGPSRVSEQRWGTFVRNHAQALVARDFCAVVTAPDKRTLTR